LSRLLASRPFVKGGEASYSQYALHLIVLRELAVPLFGRYIAGTWLFLAAIVLTLVVSRLSYLWVERPLQRWVRRLGTRVIDKGRRQSGQIGVPVEAAPPTPATTAA
jgi:peptidoglycan/LPS O-acetylase OafA/YrhL